MFSSLTLVMIILLQIRTNFGLPRFQRDTVKCSNNAADIVFALDSSFSIKDDDFKRQINFLLAVVDQLDFGPSDFRFGVISFGSDVTLDIRLDQYEGKWDLRRAITDNITHQRSGTNTWKALHYARTKMFTEEYGVRHWAKKKLVVMTDGLSSNFTATMLEAIKVKSAGIELFSIAVGMTPGDDFETESMASDPKSHHVFKVGDFRALASIVHSVSEAACDRFYGDQPSSVDQGIIIDPLPFKKKSSAVLPACKGEEAEILFLLDSSRSVWEPDFREKGPFLKKVIEHFEIAEDKTRIGLISFSDRPVTFVRLSDNQTLEHVHEALDQAPYIGGGTDTAFVLRQARTEGFSQARHYAARIIVLLTDGDEDGVSDKFQDVIKEVRKTRKSGVGVFVVGFGKRAKMANLKKLSGGPEKGGSVFHVPDVHKSVDLQMLLAERACKAAVRLARSPPPEKCPLTPSDLIFLYDSSALSRQHHNMVIRLITAVTSSYHINHRSALQVGVIRNVSQVASSSFETRPGTIASDIALTSDWTKKSYFRPLLDPSSRKSAAHALLKKVRTDYFRPDQWHLRANERRRRFIVLLVDSPLSEKNVAIVEASRLKSSGVTIAAVAIGRHYGERELEDLVSLPDSHIIRPAGKSRDRLKTTVEKIIQVLCP